MSFFKRLMRIATYSTLPAFAGLGDPVSVALGVLPGMDTFKKSLGMLDKEKEEQPAAAADTDIMPPEGTTPEEFKEAQDAKKQREKRRRSLLSPEEGGYMAEGPVYRSSLLSRG